MGHAAPLDVRTYMRDLGRAARSAARVLARADTDTKNRALHEMARELRSRSAELLEANRADVAEAARSGRDGAFIDRLTLSPKSVEQMAQGLEEVAALEDPIGRVEELVRRPSGIEVGRMRVPLGVIGIIYESRPNVTADAAALCLKAGNACILRGGSEALHSNHAIAACVRAGLRSAGLNVDINIDSVSDAAFASRVAEERRQLAADADADAQRAREQLGFRDQPET